MFKYNIIKISDVDSTNDYMLSLHSEKVFREGLVIISDHQINGRGQMGNIWESEKGKNLIISLLIEPNIIIDNQFDISKIAAFSLIDVLLNLGIKCKIKWPNDILVSNQKVSGILTHNIISKNIITHSVIGIGLNINQTIFDNYSPNATSLKTVMEKEFNVNDIMDLLLISFQNRIGAYRSGKSLVSEYLNMLYMKDRIAVFESKYSRFNGIIRGVSDSGLLIIETDNAIKEFSLSEIKMLF